MSQQRISGYQWGSNLVSDDTYRYAVFMTATFGVRVGRQTIATGAWTYHDIDGAAATALALPVGNDDHHFAALGIDSTGRLWLAVHMHNHPLRWIVTTNPQDITAWSVGPALPGINTRNTYPVFIKRPDGTLRFWLRSGPTGSGSGRSNSMCWVESEGSWSTSVPLMFQGLEVPDAGGPGINGSGADVENETNWSPYVARPAVEDHGDGTWTEHWFLIWRHRSSPAGSEAGGSYPPGMVVERTNILPSYLQYRSVTDSWHAIDGTPVTFPVHPLNNPAIQTGLTAGAEGWINLFGYTIDDDGHPHVTLSRDPVYHLWWNGESWQQAQVVTAGANYQYSTVIATPVQAVWLRGRLLYLAMGSHATNQRTPVLADESSGSIVRLGGINSLVAGFTPNYDHEALRTRGVVEVMTPTMTQASVVSFGDGARMRAAA
jgi:hypothetical protein